MRRADECRSAKLRDGLHVTVPLTVTFEPEDPRHGPTCEIDVDEQSGALVITRVSLTASPEHPISSDAVRVYSLSKLAAIGAKQMAVPAKGWEAFDDGEPWPPSNKRVMESIVAATRARVSVDRDRLDEVARLHADGRVHAVEHGLNVSRSQAYRLIKLAREQGLIEQGD